MTLRDDFEQYMQAQFPMIERGTAIWEFADLLYFGGAIQAATMAPAQLAVELEIYHAALRARQARGEFGATTEIVH